MIAAARIFLVLTLVTGVLYPAAVTAIANMLFTDQAGGSLIRVDGRMVGSELLAQRFASERYFWPRPSAADYATIPSGASNWAWSSAQFKKAVEARRATFTRTGAAQEVPGELLFASASGLDPHISPAAARYQMERVASARRLDAEQRRQLQELITRLTEPPLWGFLGEPRITVLRLNIELDRLG